MESFILQHEAAIRLSFFVGVFTLVAMVEFLLPRRPLHAPKKTRWIGNLGIVILDNLLVRLVIPSTAFGIAVIAANKGWGVFNQPPSAGWESGVRILLSVIWLDFVIYLQHVLFHMLPSLWRLHRMHHTDLDLDVTSGARFHPLEILISLFIKWAAILFIGAPPVSVIIFEVLLNATAMFNHANIRLPGPLDRVLRWVTITPDMHRVHHSVLVEETNSNYGFNLTVWDRLFGTYRAQPRDGHLGMTIGIRQFREFRYLSLPMMVIQPFLGKTGPYPSGNREDSPIR